MRKSPYALALRMLRGAIGAVVLITMLLAVLMAFNDYAERFLDLVLEWLIVTVMDWLEELDPGTRTSAPCLAPCFLEGSFFALRITPGRPIP
jgi:hypothetical protein